jgi:hypothetical protein
MQVGNERVQRMASSLVLLCAISGTAASAQQASGIQQSPETVSGAARQSTLLITELPDSPGATLAKLQASALPQGSSQQSPSASVSTAPSDPQPQSTSQPTTPPPTQKPVGTAAAESTHAGGIAASQPAGVAIAPAKQRRVRTIVIKVGAIVGAGVAVGSVVALTAATSSKPPGAH